MNKMIVPTEWVTEWFGEIGPDEFSVTDQEAQVFMEEFGIVLPVKGKVWFGPADRKGYYEVRWRGD